MGILGDILMGLIGASCNFAEKSVNSGTRDYRFTEREQAERDRKIIESVAQTRDVIDAYKSQNK